MVEKLTTLEAWAHARYGDHPPSIFTLRRWARDGKIFPQPEKHGRTYYVKECAQYVTDYNNSNFLEAVRGSTYYGRPLRCVGRYFDNLLEIVALQDVDEPWDGIIPPYRADLLNVCGMIPGHPAFFRTARALAPCVYPRVTDTLGGVMNAELCNHDLTAEKFIANAGPNIGKDCCGLCGGEIGLDGL